MSFETDFDTAFTTLLGKAVGVITTTGATTAPSTTGTTGTETGSTYSVVFLFGGGGSTLTTAVDPILLEVPDSGDLVWVHLYAGSASGAPVAVTSTLALNATTYASFGSSTSLYGAGTPPRLQADSHTSISLAGWTTHLDAGDVLISRITAFSGTATWLALIVRVRRDGT